MANKPLKICTDCNGAFQSYNRDRGKCPDCKTPECRERKDSQRVYKDKAYLRNRKWLLSAFPICQICKQALATEADHIIPVVCFDTSDPDELARCNDITNLQSSCSTCNQAKRKTDAKKFKRRF